MSVGLWPASPIVTQFFTNKIESSGDDWPHYLLEIAAIFSEFDGEPYDRQQLTARFRDLSPRSPYAHRDPDNFRDEFGQYGTFLGLFHVEPRAGGWEIVMSEAARRFLGGAEPDVEAFCRAQLSLYQYPRGGGSTYGVARDGRLTTFAEANALNYTERLVRAGVRMVPLRLILNGLLAKAQMLSQPLDRTTLSYLEIWALFNHPATNGHPNPSRESIAMVLQALRAGNAPAWLQRGRPLQNFKRNLHILEQTGLLVRVPEGRRSTALAPVTSLPGNVEAIHAIASMDTFFEGFEYCGGESNVRACVKAVIESPHWGRYYDAVDLPAGLLATITATAAIEGGERAREGEAPFPQLVPYRSEAGGGAPPVTRIGAGDPELVRIRRERANRDHARLVEHVAALARARDAEPLENIYIDLLVRFDRPYIFEMKSCTSDNLLDQVRRGISQLYEYRYRFGEPDAVLCLVLQEAPEPRRWLLDYLVEDRGIQVMWFDGGTTPRTDPRCRETLAPLLGDLGA